MLVLSRRVGEWVDIGPDVSVIVAEIGWCRCRLGIEAPRNMPVNRRELALDLAPHIGQREDVLATVSLPLALVARRHMGRWYGEVVHDGRAIHSAPAGSECEAMAQARARAYRHKAKGGGA